MRTTLVILSLGLPALACAQSIFKCTGPDGSTTLQQSPCAGAGQRMDVRPSGAPPAPSRVPAPAVIRAPSPALSNVLSPGAGNEYQNAVEHEKRTIAIAAGMSAGYPVVGMTMGQLTQVLGQPNRINTDDYGRGPEEQRIYDKGGSRYLVYTQNGRVQAVQTRSGYVSTPQPRTRGCASEIEIRNLETTASSTGMSDAMREIYAKRLRDMRDCR